MRRSLASLLVASSLVLAQGVARADDPDPERPADPAERIGLRAAVERALRSHPTAAIARAQIQRSEALVRQARSASFPTLTGNGQYTRLDSDRMLGERVAAAAGQTSANLSLAVPLIAPQRWVQWSHAKDAVEVATITAEDLRRQIAVTTARAYLSIVSQRRVIEVNLRARQTATQHLAFAKLQFEGGIATKIDQVRADQEVAVADVQLQSSYSALAKAREALGVMLGASSAVDASEDITLPEQPSESVAEQSTTVRSDIRVLQARVRANENLARDDWAMYSPILTGVFQPFYQNPPSLVVPKTGWQAQLILTIPLYDGGMRYGVRDEHRAMLAESQANLEAALRQVRADLRVSFEVVRRADRGLSSARQSAKLAVEALALANQAYQAGASTNLEVIDAERRARDAETVAAIAEDTARQARLDLLVASGRFP